MISEDLKIRIAAFKWLEEQVQLYGDILPISVLRRGFLHDGHRVPLMGPKGIFKPKVINNIPLSITTAPEHPYEDSIGPDGLVRYKYRGNDPNHPDNVGLRQAMRYGIPLVYFHGIHPGNYLAIWPVFVADEDTKNLTFLIFLGQQNLDKLRSYVPSNESESIFYNDKNNFVSFPLVDLREILTPLDRCLRVIIGPISDELVNEMKNKRYDYAPVFLSDDPNSQLLGLISRRRLEDLLGENKELTKDDKDIVFKEIPVYTNLDYILECVAEFPTRIVTHEIETERHTLYEAYGIINKSDLNKAPVRKIIFEILAKLEIALAEFIISKEMEPFNLIESLSEDSQARILGYWELSKRKNTDCGPLTGAMLSELLRIIGKYFHSEIGFKSRNEFENLTGKLAEIRNQVMHPVRPLITDEESSIKLKEALRNAMLITKRIIK